MTGWVEVPLTKTWLPRLTINMSPAELPYSVTPASMVNVAAVPPVPAAPRSTPTSTRPAIW